MSEVGSYPAVRVILGFTAAPSLAGLAVVMGDLLGTALTGRPLQDLMYYYGFSLLFMAGALMFYGLPALSIGVGCVVLRVRRSVRGVAGVTLLASALCHGWALLLASQMGLPLTIPMLPGLGAATPMVLAGCSALLMGLWVLPKGTCASR